MTSKYQEALDNIKNINLSDNPYSRLKEDNVENTFKEDIKLLQGLIDKETPKKLDTSRSYISYKQYNFGDKTEIVVIYDCPTCGCNLTGKGGKYCSECGQKLDWSTENDK